MATSSGNEFFSSTTLFIDSTIFKDTSKLCTILRCRKPDGKTDQYTYKGSFEEVEDVFMKLSTLERVDSSLRNYSKIQPVEVARVVMNYIEQKRSKELHRICGVSASLETQPCTNSFSLNPTEKMLVIFKPCEDNTRPVLVELARERFITFYQRIATDLQVQSLDLDLQKRQQLDEDFPELLISGSSSKATGVVTVTGPLLSIYRLKESLRKSPLSPSGRHADVIHQASGTSSSHNTQPNQEQICAICMDTIRETERKTLQCKHSFCKACLRTAFEYKPVCPVCGVLYGALTGTQPVGGTMKSSKHPSSLPGYEEVGHIIINYYIPSGIQTNKHPSPGQGYEGASRRAYLPDSVEGRRVLELLQRAFDQRLIFTVGQSSTSGRNHVVTWNDIHHKTSTCGGPTCYGYPDPDYLDRVTDELRVKGIE